MKILKVLPFLLASALCVSAVVPPRVTRDALTASESSLDDRLRRLWNDVGLFGGTRGVYLEGYGAVFSAEITLVTAPISMMGPPLTPQQMEQIKTTKMKRLPELKDAMKQHLVTLASSLDIPPDENVTIVLLLLRYTGETKVPVQIMLQGTKKKLLEAQGPAALDQVIRVTELY